MSSQKRDPKSAYGNFTELDTFSDDIDLSNAFYAMKDNARESLPEDMFLKVRYFLSWRYEP